MDVFRAFECLGCVCCPSPGSTSVLTASDACVWTIGVVTRSQLIFLLLLCRRAFSFAPESFGVLCVNDLSLSPCSEIGCAPPNSASFRLLPLPLACFLFLTGQVVRRGGTVPASSGGRGETHMAITNKIVNEGLRPTLPSTLFEVGVAVATKIYLSFIFCPGRDVFELRSFSGFANL